MTVAELIDKLKQMPQDAVVTIDMYSECRDLEGDEVKLVRAEDRKLVRHYPHRERLARGEELHDPKPDDYVYITWNERYKKPDDPDPEFVTACRFPGN